ncbi:MAG: RraA family protein [Tissierellia bacterium]|nr:RraA family protein [Tissierellia bacterium]
MGDIKYNSLPPLIEEEIIQMASKLSSAQLADGMKDLGMLCDGCMEASILPVSDSMKVIGTACTVSTNNGDNFPIHVSIYQGRPGYVLIIDGKGHQEHAYLGDLLMSAAKAVGLNGIVIDGFVRDKATLIDLDFPIFAKGFMQRGPIKKEPGEINTEISCGGICVQPGDLVLGDYDGITVVPRNLIEIVLEKAEKKNNYEIERRKLIEEYNKCKMEEKEVPNLAPQWVNDMKEKLKL